MATISGTTAKSPPYTREPNAGMLEAENQTATACVPSPRVSHSRLRTLHLLLVLLNMRRFLNKSTQRIQKKAEQAVDMLRPPSRQSRSVSPAPSQQFEQMIEPTIGSEYQPPSENAATSMIRLATAPTSGAVTPSQLGEHLTTEPAARPANDDYSSAPIYAEAPAPPTILETTGSALKGFLVAARDGSDLILPLKAALVGVVALWNIFDVIPPILPSDSF